MRALIAVGPLLMVQAEYARSKFVLNEALAVAEQRQDPAAVAEATTYLGHVTIVAGDRQEGRRLLQEAVRRWEALGEAHGLGETLFYLGFAADVMGDVPAAAAHYTTALGRLTDAGNAQHAGFVHSYLGVLEWRRGNPLSAAAQIRALLQTSVSLRDRWLLSFAAQATVVLVASRPRSAAWARLLGAADALGQATGGATFGWEHLPGAEHVIKLREQLAREEELNAAYGEGLTRSFASVAALAQTLLGEIALRADILDVRLGSPLAAKAPSSSPLPEELSPGELRVLRYLPTNLSRPEIAGELSVSLNTVSTHIRSIYAKLQVRDRSSAVQRARDLRLLAGGWTS
jgi:LuxR family maltose regulon positive regulatory protein